MRILAVAIALLVIAASVHADIIYVDTDATGAGTGACWADAFIDLQDALGLANGGDEIWVAEGTYAPASTKNTTVSFQLRNGVSVYGGFDGTEVFRADRDWRARRCYLTGQIAGVPGIYASEFIVRATGTDSTTILDGFTILDGQHGLLIDGGNPVIQNTVITNNTPNLNGPGPKGGAGVTLRNACRPLFRHVDFILNRAVGFSSGGGVSDESFSCRPRFEYVLFEKNSASRYGGGMYGRGEFRNVEFHENISTYGGGGLYGGGILEHCSFVGNRASGPSWVGSSSGGGMWGDGTFASVQFVDNFASTRGGGLMTDGPVSLVDAVFVGNRADRGAAICSSRGALELLNSMIVDNDAASNGGGIYLRPDNSWSALEPSGLLNVTMVRNTVETVDLFTRQANDLYSDAGDVTLINVISWMPAGNYDVLPQIYSSRKTLTVRSSTISNSGGSGSGWRVLSAIDGGNNLEDDPLFADPLRGDYHLTTESPAIDAGDDTALPSGLHDDLDGNPRIVGLGVDMGAYEFQGPGSWDIYSAEFTPRTLNLGSHGRFVQVRIEPKGTRGIDQIDAASVVLIDSIPAQSARVGPDYLKLKFDRREVAAKLNVGMQVPVVVSGLLLDGVRFFAADTIRVIDPARSSLASTAAVQASGQLSTVRWPAIGGPARSYDGYLSTDGGMSWTALFSGREVSTSYSWILDSGPADGALILIEANDAGDIVHAVTDPFTITSDVVVTAAPAPRKVYLRATPNPFNPSTTIYFGIPRDTHLTLTIYDLAGRSIKTLVTGQVAAGDHEVQWHGRDESGKRVASGVYLYQLWADEFVETRRLILVK